MRGSKFVIFSIAFLCCAFLLQMVLGAYLATTPAGGTQFSINEDVSSNITILINNTETTIGGNLTQVNISFPSSFSFVSGTNLSTAIVVTQFATPSSTMISWTNITGPLLRNQTWAYFAFNTTATSPGFYNITVYFTNGTAANYTTNLTVIVNDTSPPSADFVSPTPSDISYQSATNVTINISTSDNWNVSTIVTKIFNTTGQVNSSARVIGSSTGTFSINFPNLAEGVYTYNSTINDTFNGVISNSNASSTRTLTVDTSAPNITMAINTVSTSDFSITVTIADTLSGIGSTCSTNRGSISGTGSSQTLTESNLNCGQTVSYTVTCSDRAGNSNSNTTSFITNGCSTSSSTSSSSSSSTTSTTTTTTTWSTTFSDDASTLSTTPISRNLAPLQRTAIDVAGEQHFVGVTSISGSTATIEVASTPQQVSLVAGESKNFELDGDNYYDLLVSVISINANIANVSMQAIHEPVAETFDTSSATNTTVTGTTSTASPTRWGVWITILVVVLAIAGFAYYLFVIRKKENYD